MANPFFQPSLEPEQEPLKLGQTPSVEQAMELVEAVTTYKREAEEARRGGPNGRDGKWDENLDLYWNRYNFTAKESWQAKVVMPEVPQFVDRFAAAMKEALVSADFYTVIDPSDRDNTLTSAVKNMTNVWLSMCGRNQLGTPLDFPAVFEEQMKLGALMACSSVTGWEPDGKGSGRVTLETVDPRRIWIDHTYRNLYRIRQIEMDRSQLGSLLSQKDNRGDPIYNIGEVGRLIRDTGYGIEAELAALTGYGQQITSARGPVLLDEYYATVVRNDGTVLCDKALIVVANDKYLVRGPEANPFWHGKDWVSYTPLVTVPLSVYGRSYMEDFGKIAQTFNDLTNLILDAVYVSSLNAFAIVPEMLSNPEQLAGGVHAGKTFFLEPGFNAKDFAQAIETGSMNQQAFQIWSAIKNELREAAGINEIGLGQFAPKGRTSATEISATSQSSSALIRSVAQTVETRWLDPTLDNIWKTGVQHVGRNDAVLRAACGEQMFDALWQHRKELVSRPITFQARGISKLIERSSKLQMLIQIMQVAASNPVLLQAFMKRVSIDKLVDQFFVLSNIDPDKLQMSERDALVRQIVEPVEQARQAAIEAGPQAQQQPEGPGAAEFGQAAKLLGLSGDGAGGDGGGQ